ncbi:Protein FAM136A [Hondaea fermentalgiana]|uniref:Protein FAM136A n=1 Tax=Hondaea fermentalgiana TaxID=2315210 RepID=A0A2R5GG58_9STRA|nr:Protein FAM136A [Hondaea fermentalgiana]|eukprot:GBG27633.1 Protein FAM136A [Hondaea fermentalgiana]
MGDPNTRVQQAVGDLLESLEKQRIRPMRKEAFLCSAKCCDSAVGNEQLQNCVQECQRKTAQTESIISQELETFQQRLQRCAMGCNDRAQDQIPADPNAQTPELINRLQKEAEACANKCVDTNLASLNKIGERVNQAVKHM